MNQIIFLLKAGLLPAPVHGRPEQEKLAARESQEFKLIRVSSFAAAASGCVG